MDSHIHKMSFQKCRIDY